MRIARSGSNGRTKAHILILKTLIPDDRTKCWEWQGALDEDGYGVIGRDSARAHRISYEVFVGAIGSLNVCHSCDNRKCVNPGHLWVGDHTANAIDKTLKNRASKKGRASLSVINAISACADMQSGMTCLKAADKYGICVATASAIKNRRTWHFQS